MKKIFLTALFAGLLCCLSAQNRIIPLDTTLRYGQLDNGLTYYVKSNKTVESRADFYIVQDVGAILEEDNQDGLAHFLEHMAFNGTKNFPDKQIISYLETVGVKFGANINAYTSLDETVYNLKSVPTYREGIVDTALLVLHDWSGFLTLGSEEIDKERGVIREEWRTRNSADRRLWGESLPLLYPNSQYAKRDIIGDTAVINNFRYDALRDFYHKWYRPDLQAIIIVGDIDADKTVEKIKKLFADIPKRANPAKRNYFTIEDNEEPIVVILSDSECRMTRIRIDYRHNPMDDRLKASELGYTSMIGVSLIENMLSDRFAEIVQQQNSPFANAGAYDHEMVKTKDAFTFAAIPSENKEREAFVRLLTEAKRVKDFGFTLTELERAKTDMLSSYEKAFNERENQKNNSYVNEYIRNYLDFEPIPGIIWEFNFIQNILPAITLEDINRKAKSLITDKNIDIVITGPKEPLTRTDVLSLLDSIKNVKIEPYVDNTINEPLVSNLPKKGKVKKSEENKKFGFAEWKLSNGVKVAYKKTDFKADEILMFAFAEGGFATVENIEDLPSAYLSADVVESSGLGKFDAVQLSKSLAGKVVGISPSIGNNEESLSGSSSVKDLETLFQLAHLHFTNLRRDDNAYKSIINQYQTVLANAAADPNRAFRDSVNAIVSGHNPRSFSFDLKHLSKVQKDKVYDFFAERFSNASDFTFFFVGNIDENELKRLSETYLGSLKTDKKRNKWEDRNVRIPNGKNTCLFSKKLKVEKASNFVMYSADCEYNIKNRLNISVIKDILRLRYTESLREEEGGTYGVSTNGSLSKLPVGKALLQMSFDTDPKLREKLVGLIRSEIDTIIENGPKESDLQKVKENMLKNYKENQRENRWWLNLMVSLYRDGETLFDDYEKSIESITPESVRTTLKEIIDAKNEISVSMIPAK